MLSSGLSSRSHRHNDPLHPFVVTIRCSPKRTYPGFGSISIIPFPLRDLDSDLPDPTREHLVSDERFLLDARALPSRDPIHTGMRRIPIGVDLPPVPNITAGTCIYTDASLPSLYDIRNDGHGVFSMIVWKIHSVESSESWIS